MTDLKGFRLPSSVPARDRVLTELRKRGGTRADLAKRCQLSPTYTSEMLLGLQADGLARHTWAGHRGYLWEAVQ
jgi:DNA-binding IclR family transcriptional regulator